jgi:hypothetical protein
MNFPIHAIPNYTGKEAGEATNGKKILTPGRIWHTSGEPE